MTMTATKIEVRPLSPVLGAEITGVDLREAPDEATRAAILDAWFRHHMLVLPGQQLDDDQHVRFCEIFAPVQPERLSAHKVDRKKPGVHYVSNTRPDAILPDGEIIWHSDQPFYELPSQATTLHAIEVPSQGGETSFANCHLAYDELSDAMKQRLEGLRALNAYYYESPNRLRKTTEAREPDAPRALDDLLELAAGLGYAPGGDELTEALEAFQRAGSVLELACGTGSVLARLRSQYEAVGVDLSEEMIAVARRKLPGLAAGAR